MVDPTNWVVSITWLDENNESQTAAPAYDTRTDAIDCVNEVLVDGSHYPEGATFQKVTLCEPGVAP